MARGTTTPAKNSGLTNVRTITTAEIINIKRVNALHLLLDTQIATTSPDLEGSTACRPDVELPLRNDAIGRDVGVVVVTQVDTDGIAHCVPLQQRHLARHSFRQ